MKPGRIITFYSYKGGTGRSMALANVAWILASRRNRVLTIDWDLEAPGLHRYFRPFLLDPDITSSPGLIELVMEYAGKAKTPPEEKSLNKDWYFQYANISPYAMSLKWEFPPPGAIDFVPAGRQGRAYARNVNAFNWEHLYLDLGGGAFFERVKQNVCAEYDYILIDSRTGVSDTSGICTIQMPDTLVVCFTLNNQSIDGAATVAESVVAQRGKEQSSVSPWGFSIIPVPMRVRQAEIDKLEKRERYAKSRFSRFVDEDLWPGLSVPDVAYYSYEEVLATFRDNPGKYDTVLASMERLTTSISNREVTSLSPPTEDERRSVLDAFAELPKVHGELETESRSFELQWLPSFAFVIVLVALLGFSIYRYSAAFGSRARQSAILGFAQQSSDENPLLSVLLLKNLNPSIEPAGGLVVAQSVASKVIPSMIIDASGILYAAEFSPDGRSVATAHDDRLARMWDVATGRLIRTFRGHTDSVLSVTFDQQGKRLVTASADRTVRIWDVNAGTEISAIRVDESSFGSSANCLSKSKRFFGSGSAFGKQVPIYARFSPDEKVLLVAYPNHSVVMYQPPQNPLAPSATANCLDIYMSLNRVGGPFFTFDGRWLATMDNNQTVNLFRVQDWHVTSVTIPNLNLLALSPDSRTLLLNSAAGPADHAADNQTATKAVIWDIVSQRSLNEFTLPSPAVSGEFSPDGSRIAIALGKGNLLIGSADEGLKPLQGSFGDITSATFNNSGNSIAAISTSGSLIIWPLQPKSPPKDGDWSQVLQFLKGSTRVCLTAAERQTYLGESSTVSNYNANRCRLDYGQE